MIGQTISHYRILEKLGEGGMGVVYKAQDIRLDRPVALKFLPADATPSGEEAARFVEEAKSASALDHPNICTIYSVDQTPDGKQFLVMALYDGTTLQEDIKRGPLSLARALQTAVQLAEGLHAAHEKGIVHRDIKSSNIIITSKGQAKIMDFGLAKRSQVASLTKAGVTVGTVPYMSPEQVRGEIVDRRTDIWSLGVVMYEMISGRLPFRNEYSEALVYSILNQVPAPLTAVRTDVPAELERIVNKLLAKERNERYHGMEDLLVDLKSLAATNPGAGQSYHSLPPHSKKLRRTILFSAAAIVLALIAIGSSILFLLPGSQTNGAKSIAVLPFQNLSGNTEDDYFSDGMTESLITDLTQVQSLLVIARNSVFKFKGQTVTARRVASDLNVAYVLEGSVQRAGNTLRINAQLIDANSGVELWAAKFDREAKDLFGIQDDISKRIVSALQLSLSPAEERRLNTPPTRNLEAYDFYLRGMFALRESSLGNTSQENALAVIDSAVRLFKRAVDIDPRFARGYAGLAHAYTARFFSYDPSMEIQQNAMVANEKALSLDPGLAEAYSVRGNILWTNAYHFPHKLAVDEEKKALSINPNLVEAHESLGGIYFHVGMLDEAARELRTAIALDPMDSFSPPRVARVYWYRQAFDSSLVQFEQIGRPDWFPEQAIVLHDLGRTNDALALLQKKRGGRSRSWDSDEASVVALIDAARGNRRDAEIHIRSAIAQGQSKSHFHHAEFNIACAYSLMNDKAKAVEWLQRAAEDGLPCYPLFRNDPNLRNLQGDARYLALIEKLRVQWENFRITL